MDERLTRRGVLAGLLALPFVRLFGPLLPVAAPTPVSPLLTGAIGEYSGVVFFDLADSEVVQVWERAFMAEATRRSPLLESPLLGRGDDDAALVIAT